MLAPTRELATQIGRSFASYGRFLDIKTYVLYGGVPEGPQVTALGEGVDVLVATPGRLIDFQRRKIVDLSRVGTWVLDEADRMLDLGFSQDIRSAISTLASSMSGGWRQSVELCWARAATATRTLCWSSTS